MSLSFAKSENNYRPSCSWETHGAAEVYEHILLLGDNQLAIVRDLGRNFSGPVGAAIDRLTAEGHEFLSAARDDTRWKKAMKIVKKKAGKLLKESSHSFFLH